MAWVEVAEDRGVFENELLIALALLPADCTTVCDQS